MPDLNQRQPLLADYLIQNTLWWIEYLGLSGIRMDTYPYSDAAFMSDWSCAVMDAYPDFNVCGEEWSLMSFECKVGAVGQERAYTLLIESRIRRCLRFSCLKTVKFRRES